MWKTLSKDVRKFGAQCSFLALQFVNKEDQGAKNTSCSQVEDLSINGNQTNFSRSFKSAIKEFSTCSWSAYMGPGWRRPPMCGHAGAPKPGWVGGMTYSWEIIWPFDLQTFGIWQIFLPLTMYQSHDTYISNADSAYQKGDPAQMVLRVKKTRSL